ncbi:hypothetical protein Q4553_13275 [Tenacibaculum soleae]|uniref:hypothetical protein n=1 Tax=Tenacibaculum soleae TaxID=447689 RepID=UPI0026E47BE9|nr:hypothetical protein [Tenacibaculum soleae]MDO6745539.1 hypothetical protein [Tenacibaculum soleae]
MTSYSFNSSNKLLNAVSNISQPSNTINPTVVVTQEYTYDNNIITVDITSSIGDSKTVTLEENSSGLIHKMIENNFYVLITYDTNQNISKIEIFDNNDNLTNTSEYEYDDKPNPFYGQLSSIYLPIFLDAFDDANFNEFVWDGYEGYFFPFLKNNITSINENGNLDRNYNYVYNNENYPTNVIEIFNGNNAYEFDIEYE